MIKKLLYTAVAALALTGCSDDTWKPQLDKEGQLSLSGMGLDVITTETLSSRSDVDVSSFTVLIKQNDEIVNSWIYSAMPEIITLPVGDYTVEAYSHEVQKQDWDKPYYLGSKSFKIEENAITNIGDVICYFKSIKVTVEFDDDLLAVMSSGSKVTVVANDDGTLEFGLNETRAGYFEAIDGSNTLVATLTTTISGYDRVIPMTYTNVAPGTYYQIKYSLKDNNIPDIVIGGTITTDNGAGITIDTTVTEAPESINGDVTITEETFTVDFPEDNPQDPSNPSDPSDPTQPTTDNITFTAAGDLEFAPTHNPVTISPCQITIHSTNGFAKLIVDIASTNEDFLSDLPSMGMPLTFDLVNPEAGLDTILEGMGFTVGQANYEGKTDILFDISNFVPLLGSFTPGVHTFTITVTDNEGETASTSLIFES